MKRTISIILVIIILLAAASLSGVSGTEWSSFFGVKASAADSTGRCGNAVFYKYDSNTYTLTIYGLGPMEDNYGLYSKFLSLPQISAVVIEKGVTRIGKAAFYNCKGLYSVEIADSVTKIGDEAFRNCTALQNINLPKGLTDIGMCAFYGCENLYNITLPDGLTAIEDSIFENCVNLREINIPDKVTTIWYSAFQGCESLQSITIPESVTAIHSYAFAGCSCLGEVDIQGSLTVIREGVFENCGLNSITLPDSVKEIENSAFYDCVNLQSVNLPKSLETINSYAFYRCSLTSITFPVSIRTIRHDAFYLLDPLNDVYYDGTVEQWKKVDNFDSTIRDAAVKCKDKYYHLNHTWDNGTVVKAATYTEKGTMLFTCTGCKETKTEEIEKLKVPTVAKVSGLKASKVKTDAITLKWSNAKKADQYKVYRSTDGKKWTKITTTAKLTYTDKDVKAGKKYQYKVIGIHSGSKAKGEYSAVLKTGTLTAAPKISSLKSTKAKTATVTWKKVTGAKSYIVYKSKDNKNWTKASSTTKTTATLSKLAAGKKVYVKVVAVNAYGKNSAASTVKSLKVKE